MRKQTVPQNSTLTYLLGDHLGSTSLSLAVDASMKCAPQETCVTRIRVAMADAACLSEKKVMGSSYINHFLQPDTVVPDPHNPQDWDRFSYARNNPVKYTDPSGHDPSPCGAFAAFCLFWNWWTGKDVGYTGSGWYWGHGPRQLVETMKGTTPYVHNLAGSMQHSIMQEEYVQITGEALSEISHDPKILEFQNEIIEKAKSNPSYGVEDFSFPNPEYKPITFGGPHDDMWKSAKSQLTWMVRAANVYADVSVEKNGSINISYSFEDTLDLRPSPDRSRYYNAATRITGFYWHEVLGGNDKMKTRANWTYRYLGW